MSVQCKNCANALKKGTETKCVGWSNGGFVNPNKQRNCTRYWDKKRFEKWFEEGEQGELHKIK